MKTKNFILVIFSVIFAGILQSKAQGNTYLGGGAGFNNTASTTGNFNTGVGEVTMLSNTLGNGNSVVGRQAMYYGTSASENSGIGYQSLFALTLGSSNVAIGRSAGFGLTEGSFNTFVGPGFGTGGCGAGIGLGNANSFLGYVWAGGDVSNTIILADGGSATSAGTQRLYIDSNGYAGIGLGNNVIPQNRLDINSANAVAGTTGLKFTNFVNPRFGTLTAAATNKVLTVGSNGNVILVDDVGDGNSWQIHGNDNIAPIFFGGYSATNSTTLAQLVSINNSGFLGTRNTNGTDIVFRRGSMFSGMIGNHNTSFGLGSMGVTPSGAAMTGNYNVSYGGGAGAQITTASNNVTVGYQAYVTGNGSGNTVIGKGAGLNNTGSANVFIGHLAGENASGNDNLYIDNSNTSTPLILGNFVTETLTFNVDESANSKVTINCNGATPAAGISGLRFADMNNTAPSIKNTTKKVLSVNAETGGGDVILVNDRSIYDEDGIIDTGSTATASAPGLRTVTMGFNNLFFKSDPTAFQDGTLGSGRIYIGSSTTNLFPELNSVAPILPSDDPICQYRLLVEGGIMSEKVKVAMKTGLNWKDDVFANDYKLMTLSEIESFIKANKHLPGIESAEELVKKGLDLGDMQSKQMGKIEELTLYAIEQDKKLEQQGKEIEELKVLVKSLLEKK